MRLNGFVGATKIMAAVAVVSALLALSLTQAAAQFRQRRGLLPGGPMATGVVGGFPLGAVAAGVFRPRYYPAGGGHEPPPVRCWWQREDIWNGYDYVPNSTVAPLRRGL